MQTIPCHRCESPFERKRRGPVAHHCPPCRSALQRERNRERMARNRQPDTASVRFPAEISVSARVLTSELALPGRDNLPAVPDRLPPGNKTPAGPDEGLSTHFEDLANTLDALSTDSSAHPWWSTNPHWCVDL